MHLYISGPISSDPRPLDEKKARFNVAEARLRMVGYDVTDPFTVAPACTSDPCLYGRPEPGAQDSVHAWACFLRADLIALLRCDGVATLDGWEQSRGANLEVHTARSVGMMVAPLDDWLSSMCARCLRPFAHHFDNGPRSGCDFVGIGARETCSVCGLDVTWNGARWTDDPANPNAVYCAQSNDPYPTHVPLNAGDLRP